MDNYFLIIDNLHKMRRECLKMNRNLKLEKLIGHTNNYYFQQKKFD